MNNLKQKCFLTIRVGPYRKFDHSMKRPSTRQRDDLPNITKAM